MVIVLQRRLRLERSLIMIDIDGNMIALDDAMQRAWSAPVAIWNKNFEERPNSMHPDYILPLFPVPNTLLRPNISPISYRRLLIDRAGNANVEIDPVLPFEA